MIPMFLAEIPAGNPITFQGVNNIFLTLMGFLMGLSGIIMVIALVVTGMLMIFSQGDPKKFQSAKEMLKTTIYGSAVILGASFIVDLVTQVFSGGFTLAPITDLATYIVTSLGDFVIGLSGVVMITFIVISGIMMATAGDDAAKAKKARAMLVNVIWGSLVIMGAGVILNTILAIVNGSFFCQISIIGICIWG